MRKIANKNLKIKDPAEDAGKRKYVRPELVRKEKLLEVTAGDVEIS